ncbi:MAG: hypothetical protein OXF01_17980 [Gemmatimonadetes bacterium]|nr:hypothetical protein [Gemmatimonadota bacterium]
MTPAEHFAQRTWSTLGRAEQFKVRFGEETLTDLLVLDMLPHGRTRGFWLGSTTKPAEGQCGADLLVFLRHRTDRFFVLALQAKKLYPDDRYRMLNRVSDSEGQLDKLVGFARQFHALPLYLLYNHSNMVVRSDHWHCCQKRFDKHQLGCTLVPSWHIRRMLLCRPPPPRDFDSAHKVKQAKPWRCAFDCQSAENELRRMAFPTPQHYSDTPSADNWIFERRVADAWPEWLFDKSTSQLTREDLYRLLSDAGTAPEDSFESDESLYPARVLMIDRPRESAVS